MKLNLKDTVKTRTSRQTREPQPDTVTHVK